MNLSIFNCSLFSEIIITEKTVLTFLNWQFIINLVRYGDRFFVQCVRDLCIREKKVDVKTTSREFAYLSDSLIYHKIQIK